MNIKHSFPENEEEDFDLEFDVEEDFEILPAGGRGVMLRAWREDEFGNRQIYDIRLEAEDIERINHFLK